MPGRSFLTFGRWAPDGLTGTTVTEHEGHRLKSVTQLEWKCLVEMVVPLKANVCYVDCVPSTRFESQTQGTAGFHGHLPPVSDDHRAFAKTDYISNPHGTSPRVLIQPALCNHLSPYRLESYTVRLIQYYNLLLPQSNLHIIYYVCQPVDLSHTSSPYTRIWSITC